MSIPMAIAFQESAVETSVSNHHLPEVQSTDVLPARHMVSVQVALIVTVCPPDTLIMTYWDQP